MGRDHTSETDSCNYQRQLITQSLRKPPWCTWTVNEIVVWTGIVVGFGFHTAIPEENFPTVHTFHTLKNRELSIVFVKLDRYTGTQLSTDVAKHKIVPFTECECVNEIRLSVNGIVWVLHALATDHFMNKNFIAENIKINEFYNNLNEKFNTDEEI